jgi:membrane protease subunit HflK
MTHRLPRLVLAALALGLLLWTAWTCLAAVEPGQRGVVRRFGRVIAVVGPGLHVGLPWGIDRVQPVAVDRERSITIGYTTAESDDLGITSPPGQLLTGDHNLVNATVVIQYVVNDAEVERYALYGDAADGLIARAAEAVLAEWVAGRGVDEVLLRGRAALPPVLVDQTQKRIGPYELGVVIKTANVKDINPPPQVKSAFDEVNRAQNEIVTRINKANQDANTLWQQAEADALRIQRLTEADVRNKKMLAETDARAFNERLTQVQKIQKDHKNYLNDLWVEEMTRIYRTMQSTGSIRLLDGRLSGGGIDIIEHPLAPK